jgi:hypothetical protein
VEITTAIARRRMGEAPSKYRQYGIGHLDSGRAH